jgi:hypothetical protein
MKALILGFAILSATSVSFADPVIDCPPDYRGGTVHHAMTIHEDANGDLTAVLTNENGLSQIIQGQPDSREMKQVLDEVSAVDCKFY